MSGKMSGFARLMLQRVPYNLHLGPTVKIIFGIATEIS